MATSHPAASKLALALCALGAMGADCQTDGFFPPVVVPPLEPVGVMALAGPDLVVLEGSRVALNGRASRAFGGEPALAWSQVAGTPVLLTNPSAPLPAFTAPFADDTLVFELRADAGGAFAVDQVVVAVVSAEGGERGAAGFVIAPGDTVAEPGSSHTFSVNVQGAEQSPASLNARLSCLDGGTVDVVPAGPLSADVTVVLPPTLPCAVVLDGVDAGGRGLAPAVRVFWPAGTPLPPPTSLQLLDEDGQDPLPTPQLDPGASATVVLDDDTEGRFWSVDGSDDVLAGGAAGASVLIVGPRTANRELLIAGEALLGPASGGVKLETVDVTAGPSNLAPRANGGPDRVVAPGAVFRLDTAASRDLDNDAITVTAEQVLGASALPDASIAGAFRAPDTAGPLLFHVVADDGIARSEPDPVRVVVSTDSENQAPVLELPTTRYAIPGETFAVDGSDAEDPDSGFIASVTIAQADTDLVQLLPEPVEASRVELEAGAAGDEYHFLISAYDEEGLGVTVEQTVKVEEAGPYVDPVRGSDPPTGLGNGTVAAPFASVGGALATAVLHELPELLLAAGTHVPLGSVVLPRGVSLRGGVVFDPEGGEAGAGAYVDDPLAVTVLPVTGDGLGVVDGRLSTMTLDLTSTAASITLEGSANLEGAIVTVSAAEHAAPLVIVRGPAATRISDAILVPRIGAGPSASPAAPTLVVEDGAVARVVGTVVAGADGPDAVGILCGAATVSLEDSDITGGADAARATGVRADAGCALDVAATRVAGGIAGEALGIDATDTLLTTDGASTLVGSTSVAGETGIAVRFAGRERSALIESRLLAVDVDADPVASAANAAAIVCDDAQVGLDSAVLEARGVSAVGVEPNGCVLVGVGAVVVSDGAGVRASVGALAENVTLIAGSIEASEIAVDLDGEAGSHTLRGVVITAGAMGVRVAGDIELDDVSITVAGADEPVGIDAGAANIADSDITVTGGAARGVIVVGPSVLQRSVVRTGASAAAALTHDDALSLESSIVVVTGAPAISSNGALALRHATLLVDGAAGVQLNTAAGASLEAFNSYVTAIESDGAPWTQAASLAFALPGPFVVVPGGPLSTVQALEDAGCDSCLAVDPVLVLDATGHLIAGDNALVDAGDDDLSTPDDVDGEPRPQGAAPDIGADESPAP